MDFKSSTQTPQGPDTPVSDLISTATQWSQYVHCGLSHLSAYSGSLSISAPTVGQDKIVLKFN